jgi:hypothetical protein
VYKRPDRMHTVQMQATEEEFAATTARSSGAQLTFH